MFRTLLVKSIVKHSGSALQRDNPDVPGIYTAQAAVQRMDSLCFFAERLRVWRIPFLQLATPELQERNLAIMTLISLATSVAFVYSAAAQFINLGEGFFWELVTLIGTVLSASVGKTLTYISHMSQFIIVEMFDF